MKKIDNSTMGGRIKEQRLMRGMTQEQLAEQLFIKKSIVSCYENNRIDIKQSRIEALADMLDTTIENAKVMSILEKKLEEK
ncbi:MAG: helix-turn-helix transcriptional regulator [Lachnospiraceae bacterium]